MTKHDGWSVTQYDPPFHGGHQHGFHLEMAKQHGNKISWNTVVI